MAASLRHAENENASEEALAGANANASLRGWRHDNSYQAGPPDASRAGSGLATRTRLLYLGAPMRRFVILGRTAIASPDFLLEDVPGTGGRIDALLRCVRSALLVSHGVRRDTNLYLVLMGGPDAPRTLRFEGFSAHFIRPDERQLAVLVKKILAEPKGTSVFSPVRQGISIAEGGLDAVLADLGPGERYVLEEGGPDVRAQSIDTDNPVFFLGDHLGLDDAARAHVGHALAVSLGPTSVLAEDAIALMHNELDRRAV